MIANLRHGIARNFGDEASAIAYERELEAARQKMTSRYALAPGQSLNTLRGVLAEAESIEPSDIADVTTADGTVVPAWRAFELLVQKGVIIERLR